MKIIFNGMTKLIKYLKLNGLHALKYIYIIFGFSGGGLHQNQPEKPKRKVLNILSIFSCPIHDTGIAKHLNDAKFYGASVSDNST